MSEKIYTLHEKYIQVSQDYRIHMTGGVLWDLNRYALPNTSYNEIDLIMII